MVTLMEKKCKWGGADICTLIAGSLSCTAETNIVKQLYSNKIELKITQ